MGSDLAQTSYAFDPPPVLRGPGGAGARPPEAARRARRLRIQVRPLPRHRIRAAYTSGKTSWNSFINRNFNVEVSRL